MDISARSDCKIRVLWYCVVVCNNDTCFVNLLRQYMKTGSRDKKEIITQKEIAAQSPIQKKR